MLLFYFLLVLHAVLAHGHHRRENKIFYKEDDAQLHFEKFLKTHNKIYDSELEKATKFNTFKENLLKINEMNRQDPHSSFVINKFTDLSSEEFLMMHTGLRLDLAGTDSLAACRSVYDMDLDPRVVPEALDWRDNITLLVKEQQTCGACWAFAATANVEAQYSLKYNKSLALSEQQILDCDTGDDGCGGGFSGQALRYLIQVGGQESEAEYPYINKENAVCLLWPTNIRVEVTDCIALRLSSEVVVQQALTLYGPLVAAIDASTLQSYNGGIMSNCLFQGLNHAVLIVGFGTEEGRDFWIIKNSWGTHWGENGYFKIDRNVNACGILNPYMVTSFIA